MLVLEPGKRSHLPSFCLAVSALLLLPAAVADATIIQDNAQGWQITVSDWAADMGASVVVHDSPPRELVIEISKVFTGGLDDYGHLPAIYMNFTQVEPDEATASRIVILDESIQNNTNCHWYDFHWYLITYGAASFNKAETFPSEFFRDPVPRAADFAINPFTAHSWQEQGSGSGKVEVLSAFDGMVPVGDQFNPGGGPAGGELVIDVDLKASRGNLFFALKELPTIPEPGSFILLLICASAMTGRKRSR